MEHLWEQHKATIRDLYLVKDMTKNDVVEEMARRGFKACGDQFERHFKKWNFRKNLTREEWQHVSRSIEKRKREGKESDLEIDGILIPQKKVQKAISRYGQGSTLELMQRAVKEGQGKRSPTPDGLVVCTPIPDGLVVCSPTPDGLIACTPSESISSEFSMDFLPWFNFYNTIQSNLRSEGWLYSGSESVSHHKSSSVWSEAVRASIPVPHLDFGNSTSSNICNDIIQGSGFNKFAFAVFLTSNRMHEVFNSTSALSKQDLGRIILQHLQCGKNFPVLNFLFVNHNETIDALSEIIFKEALLELNVGLVDLMLSCFKVNADSLLPGPWGLPLGSRKNSKKSYGTYSGALLPLELAMTTKHAPMVRTLIRKGANILSKGSYGQPMFFVALNSTPEIFHLVLDASPSPTRSYDFLRAVCLGFSNDVEILLAHGMDPDTCDYHFGGPALAAAIHTANFDIANLLLDAGADVDLYDFYERSPLRLAVQHQNLELVRRLLRLGALLEDGYHDGDCTENIVSSAVVKGDYDLTHALLECGADPDAGELWPPMDIATRSGYTSIAKLLLDYGAEVCSDDLGTAIDYGYPDLIQLLLDHGASIDQSVFCHAAKEGNFDMVKRSLSAGIDINACYNESSPHKTALNLTIEEDPDCFEMASFLIDSGADINHPEAKPTALQAAILRSNTDLIDLLLQRDARCDHPGVLQTAACGRSFQTLKKVIDASTNQAILHQTHRPCLYHPALAIAAQYGKLENVEIILGLDVGIATPCSVSALQKCSTKSFPLLRRLLDAGIPVNIPANLASFSCIPPPTDYWEPEKSPTQHFAISGSDEAVQLLLDHGADPHYSGCILRWESGLRKRQKMESVVSTVAANCSTEVLERVLKAGVIVNPLVMGDFERTPLQNAAEHGKLDNLELILHAGGDVNAPAAACGGVTALQAAAVSGYLGIATRLLEAGADVNAPMAEEEGRTALEGAAEYGRLDMIQLLLSAGADIESPQFGILQYERAVERARENGHNAAARLLEKHRSRPRQD